MKLEIHAKSDGAALHPIRKRDCELVAKAKGRHLKWAAEEPRNSRRHRKFFATIAEAFTQWPAAHAFQPVDVEHLRAWLLVQAGYCATMDLPVSRREMDLARRLTEGVLMFSGSKHVFLHVTTGGGLQARRPRSMSFSAMSEAEMRPVMTRVFEIIRAEAGLDPDALGREHGKAA